MWKMIVQYFISVDCSKAKQIAGHIFLLISGKYLGDRIEYELIYSLRQEAPSGLFS